MKWEINGELSALERKNLMAQLTAVPCKQISLHQSRRSKQGRQRLLSPYLTGGGQRLQPVFCIVYQASMELCRKIRRLDPT
ncbi:hypothetical protein Syncc8109_2300 [Synechococcus sp. WH 8109]|nr:hypothetical protein Syncc8109_2300 [Synechococcus sp. WH 8109]